MDKQLFLSYFNFTKKERNGLIVICILIITISVIPFFFGYFVQPAPFAFANFKQQIDALNQKKVDTNYKFTAKKYDDNNTNFALGYTANTNVVEGELFYFNPNTLDELGWKKLGIKDKTIATIKNYISKGGKFYKPTDIAKIWGITAQQADRLIPYVNIDKGETEKHFFTNTTYENTYEKKKYTPAIVDINTADTAAFIALPGIGSKLAQRIVTTREKLGGFYKVDQIAETFGLADSVYQKIKNRFSIIPNNFKFININTATLEALKAHPYCRYTIANAIINYRTQHGNFNNTADLKKIMLVTDEVFAKLSPYLTIK